MDKPFYWDVRDVDHFLHGRCRVEDLYPSERAILDTVLSDSGLLLEAGCGSGSLAGAFRALRPSLRYAGFDLSRVLVEEGKKAEPREALFRADTTKIPIRSASCGVVVAFGLLQLFPDYAPVARELYRAASDWLVFDCRTHEGRETIADVRRAWQGGGGLAVPYVLLTPEDLSALLRSFEPAPSEVRVHGYVHAPAADVTLPPEVSSVAPVVVAARKPRAGGGGTAWSVSYPWRFPRVGSSGS